MAKMNSRFAGSCSICGRRFPAGAEIDYDSKTRSAAHWACKRDEKPIPEGVATFQIGGGSGYGCEGWTQGQVIRSPKRDVAERGYPPYLYVLRAQSRYVREDGMSFGVGDESGHLYSATCRAATDEEAAPRIAAERRKAAIEAAKARLESIKRDIQKRGERPEGSNIVDGERLFDTQNIYGGGDWFVLQPEYIWYMQNNGTDGGDWSANNVRTGGAGAIGWRIPRTDATVAMLYAVRDVVGSKIEDEARERELWAMVEDDKLIVD